MAIANPATVEWKEHWRRATSWTASELARLCCGWNPSEEAFPDPAAHSAAMQAILRAVRIRELPVIDLVIPATRDEFFYGYAPLFRPSDVSAWAARCYPSTFPYSDGAVEQPTPVAGVVVVLPHTTRVLDAMFEIMRKHWTGTEDDPPKQDSIAREFDEVLGWNSQSNGEPSRNAQALAAAIRPDNLRKQDSRIPLVRRQPK